MLEGYESDDEDDKHWEPWSLVGTNGQKADLYQCIIDWYRDHPDPAVRVVKRLVGNGTSIDAGVQEQTSGSSASSVSDEVQV